MFRATGFADLPNEIPNTLETRFASASAGKVFVAVGILQLIEQGRLNFEDTLGDRIDIAWNDIDRDVTVRQLLTHTSGVPDYFDESVMEEYEELWTDFPNYKIRHNSDLLPLMIHKPMMYPKGTEFQYKNTLLEWRHFLLRHSKEESQNRHSSYDFIYQKCCNKRNQYNQPKLSCNADR